MRAEPLVQARQKNFDTRLGLRSDAPMVDFREVSGPTSVRINEIRRMDWFTRIAGFKENAYAATRAQFEVHGRTLRSKASGRSFGIGEFELASLDDLRARVAAGSGGEGRPRMQIVTGDVRKMHQAPEYTGALFQVASQFNALEMVGPSLTPEDGVTRYEHDCTQGPTCAMAAGAATIYRNYFAPVGNQIGQTAARQLDGLADVGAELSARLERPVADLWDWRNGYALCTREGLGLITDHLRAIEPAQADALAGKLRVGIHRDVEVTDAPGAPAPVVSQAFCSALPVAYWRVPQQHWAAFAQLVLDAAYEATMLETVLNARRVQHRSAHHVGWRRLRQCARVDSFRDHEGGEPGVGF